ncbi:MAG TPA: phage holin family protein [Chthoniobacterales bacterium]|nr:phage holin family protein [Chthoniobacterales bacterium]
MASSPSGNRTRQPGLIGSLVALASALADFFESRAALFASESKAAAVQFLIVAICLIAALLFFAFGYVFLLAGGVAAIAHWANVSWVWIALDAAALHILIALIFILVAMSGIKRPVFRDSLAELKKDREWLKDLETNRTRS